VRTIFGIRFASAPFDGSAIVEIDLADVGGSGLAAGGLSRWCRGKAFGVQPAFSQDSPGDASQLVGERDGDNVVVCAGRELIGPKVNRPRFAAFADKDSVGALDEEATNVGIAALADPKEFRLAAGRMLAWDQSQPGREIASAPKRSAIADGCYQRRRDDRANTRDTHQPSRQVVGLGDQFDLPRDLGDRFLEMLPLRPEMVKDAAHPLRYAIIRSRPDRRGKMRMLSD